MNLVLEYPVFVIITITRYGCKSEIYDPIDIHLFEPKQHISIRKSYDTNDKKQKSNEMFCPKNLWSKQSPEFSTTSAFAFFPQDRSDGHSWVLVNNPSATLFDTFKQHSVRPRISLA